MYTLMLKQVTFPKSCENGDTPCTMYISLILSGKNQLTIDNIFGLLIYVHIGKLTLSVTVGCMLGLINCLTSITSCVTLKRNDG